MVKIRANFNISKADLDEEHPYTYRIKWTLLDVSYYGVRYAEKCYPNELWKTYFTSSKKVKLYRELYGEPDILEIRQIFDDPFSAVKWEGRVLDKLDVCQNNKWLNKAKGQGRVLGKGEYHNWYGKILNNNHKNKISIALENRQFSSNTIIKMSEGQKRRFANNSVWNKNISFEENTLSKKYILISPNQEIFHITGLESLPKYHNLSIYIMKKSLKNGLVIQKGKHKGWKLENNA